MARVRRKSRSDIALQANRIKNRLIMAPVTTPTTYSRVQRVEDASNRYLKNIRAIQRQRGMAEGTKANDARYTRSQYTGQSRGSIGG